MENDDGNRSLNRTESSSGKPGGQLVGQNRRLTDSPSTSATRRSSSDQVALLNRTTGGPMRASLGGHDHNNDGREGQEMTTKQPPQKRRPRSHLRGTRSNGIFTLFIKIFVKFFKSKFRFSLN
jgi:hypothetical protein